MGDEISQRGQDAWYGAVLLQRLLPRRSIARRPPFVSQLFRSFTVSLTAFRFCAKVFSWHTVFSLPKCILISSPPLNSPHRTAFCFQEFIAQIRITPFFPKK